MSKPITIAVLLLTVATLGGVQQVCATTPTPPQPMACCQSGSDIPSCCCQNPAEGAPPQPATPTPPNHGEHAALVSSPLPVFAVAASSLATIAGGCAAHADASLPTYLDNCTFRC